MKKYTAILLLLSCFFSVGAQNTITSSNTLNHDMVVDKDATNWELSYDFMGTDAGAKQATCTGDMIPPDILCPQNITQGTSTANCGTPVFFYPTATDNCLETVECDPPSGSFFPNGTTTVTCTATDMSNNTASCMFDVTVISEVIPPTIICPNDIIVANEPGLCYALAEWAVPSATDNCGVSAVICEPASTSFFPFGTSTVNCTAIDISGNTSSCEFTVTVIDTETPIIACDDITAIADPNTCDAVVTWPDFVSDNCGISSFICDQPSGSSFPVGTNTVTCITMDASGNEDVCTFDVNVVDNEPTFINCPNDMVVSSNPNTCDAVVTWADPVSNSCSDLMTFCQIPSGSNFSIGTTEVFCLITNPFTTIVCTFDVTVTDDCLANCPPVINLNNTTVNGLYHAENSVSATNTITSGTNANFKAGDAVELKNGFAAPSNTNFSAEIENCTGNGNQN